MPEHDSEESDIGRLMEDRELIDRAMAQAHTITILRHRQTGVPLAVWRDGKVVLVPADEIPLPGEEGQGDG
ncbi:MAG TPA: hypothetical protein VFQ45_09270 [Longimicrobium sp.]|nr:hypothetical protein [Longimicrobium sp.]